MAECEPPFEAGWRKNRPIQLVETHFVPWWARSDVQYAKNLLEYSPEPIEYDHADQDYQDNCFFFPEDCSPLYLLHTPPLSPIDKLSSPVEDVSDDEMIPELPGIKMLDTAALSDLLADNLSPPEISSIIVFSTNGAIFAHASPLSPRQLRNLSATYGAAYISYAKRSSSGNLTAVNPASHPSSFATTPSLPLGDVGSIVLEIEKQVGVVTKIGDRVLLAVVGPSQVREDSTDNMNDAAPPLLGSDPPHMTQSTSASVDHCTNGTTPNGAPETAHPSDADRRIADPNTDPQRHLETQWEIDRSTDLARLARLNLASSPEILLALESKSAALGRFLGQKLEELEFPDDF